MSEKPLFKYQLKCQSCNRTFSDFLKLDYCKACRNEGIKADRRKKEANSFKKVKEVLHRQVSISIQRSQLNIPKPELGYKFEEVMVDADYLSRFVGPKNRRRISKSHVGSLSKLLFHGRHFESPIVVNITLDGLRVIDGNHRIEAIKKVLSRFPKFKLPILMISYKGLDEDGEIEAFRKWNVGRVQSTDDFIQSIAAKTPFIRWLKNDFPVPITVYRDYDSVYVRLLAGALLAAKRADDTGYGLKKENFAQDLLELTEKDYETCKEFINGFVKVFGKPRKGNIYYSTTPFTSFFYTWFEYREKSNIWALFRERVLGNEEVLQFSKFGGREAHRKMLSVIFDLLKLKGKLRESEGG